MAKKQTEYQVIVKVTIETVLKIVANSFEEALSKAGEFGVRDVVSFDTEYNDGDIRVVGVFKDEN